MRFIAVNYHYVRQDFRAPFPAINGLTPDQLRTQLAVLAGIGTIVTPHQFFSTICDGSALPSTAILITFDDGLKEQFTTAKPVLDELGIQALYFVNVQNMIERRVSTVHQIHLLRARLGDDALYRNITRARDLGPLSDAEREEALQHYSYDDAEAAVLKYLLNMKMPIQMQIDVIDALFRRHFDHEATAADLYMNREQLVSLAGSGQLGSHSYSHVLLGALTADECAADLDRGKRDLEHLVQQPVETLSYPYGSRQACLPPVQQAARTCGYRAAFTMERAANDARSLRNGPLALARFDCNDVPGGKACSHPASTFMEAVPLRSWFIEGDEWYAPSF